MQYERPKPFKKVLKMHKKEIMDVCSMVDMNMLDQKCQNGGDQEENGIVLEVDESQYSETFHQGPLR